MELITRAEARERGLKRYFTGKPCLRGHIGERLTSTYNCLSCEQKPWVKPESSKEKDRLARKARRDKDPVAARAYEAAYRVKNRDKLAKYSSKYYKNIDRVRINEARKKRLSRDVVAACAHRVRRLIGRCFEKAGFGKGSKSAEILGCDWEFLKTHIERQFLAGMSWENRHLWHIDHIVALASAETEADVIALNHFTNLRPLWIPENLAKSDLPLFLI